MEQQELAAVIFEEGETDEPAVPLYQPAIPYPDRARDLEIEGILEVTFTIDPRGKVTSIEVVRSPHITITNAARKIIATWRFKPAKNKGVPVHMRVRQVIEFTLE
jgi:protein TonB